MSAVRRGRRVVATPVRRGPMVVAAVLGMMLAAFVLGGCSGSGSPPPASGTVIAPAERTVSAPLRGELLDGSGSFDVADHAGDVIVVNFWASWCAPCVTEADDLEQTYLATRDRGVTFVGVNINDGRDKARQFVVGRASYPSVFDPAGKLALGYSVPPTAIPTTLIIDRQGRVAVVIQRAVLRDELEPLVTQIAAESG